MTTHAPPSTRRGTLLSWLLLQACAAACDGGITPPPDDARAADVAADVSPDASPDVAIDAAADDAADVAADAPVDAPSEAGADAGALTWTRCGMLQCAQMTVPRDWDDPTGPSIRLALVRSPARSAAQRLGVLMVNFGGPGAPTVSALQGGVTELLQGGTATLINRFDIVGVDWRGVGRSAPSVTCFSPSLITRLREAPAVPEGDAQWAQFASVYAEIQAGCTSMNDPELLRRMGTAQAARDMDAVRERLGEERINYLGYSYGTYLGAVYAALFPTRVRAFVLDSPYTNHPDRRDRWRTNAAAIDDALSRFFAWCAGSATCEFHADPPDDPAAVAAAFDSLMLRLHDAPLTVAGRPPLDDGAARLAVPVLLYAPQFQWRELGHDLALARAGNGLALRALADSFLAPDPGRETNVYVSGAVVISGVDGALPSDVTAASLRTFIETELAPMAPRAGAASALSELAIFVGWSIRAPAPLPSLATTAPPMLLLGTRHDPATPYAEARAMQAQMNNGSHLLTYEGDGHASAARVACMGEVATAFLINPLRAPTQLRCEAEFP